MNTKCRMSTFRPLPPMFSPTSYSSRPSTFRTSSDSTLAKKSVKLKNDEMDQDFEAQKRENLAFIVSEIHRKKEKEEKSNHENQSKVYSNLFPESKNSEKERKETNKFRKETSFSVFRDPSSLLEEDSEHEAVTRHISNSHRDRDDFRDSTLSRNADFLILKFEEERRSKVDRKVLQRKQRLDQVVENIRANSIAKLEERINSMRLEEENFNKSLARDDEDAEVRLRAEQVRLGAEYERRERERDARLKALANAELAKAAKEQAIQEQFEEVQRREAELEEQRRLQQEQNHQLLEELKNSLTQFETIAVKTKDIFDQNSLRLLLDQFGIDLTAIGDVIDGQAEFDLEFVQGSAAGLNEVTELIETKLQEIEAQQEQYEKEEREKQEREKLEAEEKALQNATQQNVVQQNVVQQNVVQQNVVQQNVAHQDVVQQDIVQHPAIPTGDHDQVSPANWERYQQLRNFKHNFTHEIHPLHQDKEMKQFMFLCKKAVNIPVNSIGRTTSSHLMDKINKLIDLLRGQTIEVQDNQFSAAAHPLGIMYCKSLLAAKLVKQGEEVVRSQPKDAFTVAAVVTALWSEFPDFGDLFLTDLFETCPFLIPCYFVKKEGMTEEEYYKRLGYNFDSDNKVEDQVNFENRMGGVCRLYAAIMVSTLPKESLRAKRDHPHGIGNAWRWLASCLNLKPVNGVTTTLMVNILEVCGHELLEKYKIHFRNLIQTLAQDYFNLIRSSSLEASRNRLEMILEKVITTGAIKQPEGILNQGFL